MAPNVDDVPLRQTAHGVFPAGVLNQQLLTWLHVTTNPAHKVPAAIKFHGYAVTSRLSHRAASAPPVDGVYSDTLEFKTWLTHVAPTVQYSN